MKKIKLSDLISYYKEKVSSKDEFFKYYFEETDLESKLSKLEMMYDVLGDITMPQDYFMIFLYAGHWYQDKDRFKVTKEMIKDIYEIISKYDDIPISIIDSLLLYYDEECFEEYPAKEYVHYLISTYQYSDEVSKRYYHFIEFHKKLLCELYEKECQKIDFYKHIYGDKFIQELKFIILRHHIKADSIIKLLPSKEFMDKSIVITPHGYSIKSGEDLVTRILLRYIDLDKFSDDEYIILGPSSVGGIVLSSFTKKEYLEELEKTKVKKIEKR